MLVFKIPDILPKIAGILRPTIDIAMIAFILYMAYDILIKTNGIQIIKAALIIALVYFIAGILHLDTLLWILSTIGPGIVIMIFAIVFQPELRMLFLKMGRAKWFDKKTNSNFTSSDVIEEVLIAAKSLSNERRGMLVVFARESIKESIMTKGVTLNADVSSSILITIFESDTPLHDGACVIEGSKIVQAGRSINHLSESNVIKKTLGTRHRAALGLSEISDYVSLVVSEETGAISLTYNSNLDYDLPDVAIRKILKKLLDGDENYNAEIKTEELADDAI